MMLVWDGVSAFLCVHNSVERNLLELVINKCCEQVFVLSENTSIKQSCYAVNL